MRFLESILSPFGLGPRMNRPANLDTSVLLNSGHRIPVIGLGVYRVKPGVPTEKAVAWALEAGYRHIDTAVIYRNEEHVGKTLQQSDLHRDEIFVTTKLTPRLVGTPDDLERSLEKLSMDYVDLYLVHFPSNNPQARKETWQMVEQLKRAGKCRAVGVSNYTIGYLRELLAYAEIKPAVNQVEFSPFLYQRDLLDFCNEHEIRVEAYSPLTQGTKLNDPRLIKVASKYRKSTAQVLIRWALQHGLIVLPRSQNKDRIRENIKVFDFELKPKDMEMLDSFDEGYRTCWSPDIAERLETGRRS